MKIPLIPPHIKLLLVGLVLAATFASGFGVRSYIAGKDALAAEVEDLKQDKLEFADYIKKSEQQVSAYNLLQTRLHTLDVNHTKVLNEELAENSRLRGDLATARGMRLKGATCQGSAQAANPAAGSVGDGAEVVFSDETRQAVFDLRESLIRDGRKIDYLQRYLREQGLSPPAE